MTAAKPYYRHPWVEQYIGKWLCLFLLVYGSDSSSSNASEPAKTADQNLYKAIYAGDTFQLTRKITLNLGVRVDLPGGWTERF